MINLLNPENCEAEVLQPHLAGLLGSLVTTLQTTSPAVQSPCLSLLGCAAQVAEDGFDMYYSSFMPGIKSILTTAIAPEQGIVRGKAMECAGLLCDAVGVEVFSADAMELMTLFIRAIVSIVLSNLML